MTRFNHWLERKGIHFIAGLFLVVLVVTTAISCSPQEVPQPGTEHVDPEPLLYDLSLGILAAYVFHYLVVVLPAKRREASRLLALLGPLTTIANNGVDLIRELERIAKCPHYRMTDEHLTAVLNGLHNNEYIRQHIDNRMREAEQAYQDIIPYAADLPLDLQERLQRENQSLMHGAFTSYSGKQNRWPHSLKKLRTPNDGMTLGPYLSLFRQYYTTTEAVRESLNKQMPPLRYGGMEMAALKSVRRSRTFDLERKREYPYKDYPPPLEFKPRVTVESMKGKEPVAQEPQPDKDENAVVVAHEPASK